MRPVVDRTLARHGLDPRTLTLEITESAFTNEATTVLETLDALAARGVRLAIDDFGTGYSSFARLDQLPVRMLKIDRAFTARLTASTTGVMRGLLGLAEAMDLEVLVEGVETAEQSQLAGDLGVRFAQGYLFSRPVAADELEALLSASSAAA